MENQGIRLKQVIEKIGVNNIVFAEMMDITPNYVSMMISGKKKISDKIVFNITKVLPSLNPEWLETGEGEMLSTETFPELSHPFTKNKTDILNRLAKLEETQNIVQSDLLRMFRVVMDLQERIQSTEETTKQLSNKT
ncbi:helix-turn-helix transcriptional regulator [Lutibacter holmesii]|uniref:Helix-turn-helix transcriptional regulator n=1 Tax=Lutibacter holmesii TaxID=1137985 RepID=A0ABW3WN71_9FLAO